MGYRRAVKNRNKNLPLKTIQKLMEDNMKLNKKFKNYKQKVKEAFNKKVEELEGLDHDFSFEICQIKDIMEEVGIK